ncbi:tagaturonate reductase [Filimonas lacunae]|uniref:Tagaturonate reductase n=1 Tax=Filimonas lacunae TaxID=477680 RepID=A0A173MAF5_9BACT|nr:tagaturonate reductase [Filimonas lacunae]BAV04525.1 altronate oxidoreductase [Filimonas lacunae]SIT31687.1 tagaturonate reductase [Filimonas lacunae]
MILSKATLPAIKAQPGVSMPPANVFALPEKVLQFGTGVLLRGLPDYFIDKANRQGVFNGRVVIVKSTSQGGDSAAFTQQDNLYTHHIKGIVNGQLVEETVINSSVSRVLSAQDQWQEVLALAGSPALEVVISNTTEVGITLVKESVTEGVPASFPGKLLAVLYKRYKEGGKGLVIIPTELISDNGTKLRGIIEELAGFNQLEPSFLQWLSTENEFCNSLVDRIVPGKLPAADQAAAEAALGFKDDLGIMSECYSLWAIEAKTARSKAALSFSTVDEGVVIADDILAFKELKLRCLNGTHTFSCGLAVLAGFVTVKAAMQDSAFEKYVSTLMQEEIAGAITSKVITPEAAAKFASQVIDRFKNPHIEHLWLSITMQYTSKMAMRNVPIINWYYEKKQSVPAHMALGMAAYLLFMRSQKNAEGKFEGTANGKTYIINDDKAGILYEKWQQFSGLSLVQQVLSDTALWGSDLSALNGFADAVAHYLDVLSTQPVSSIVADLDTKKVIG